MVEQFIIAIQIILIDIVMAADNAIIIGLIAANFAPQNKKENNRLGSCWSIYL
jgi:Integral membrane protein TerC family.